MAESGGRPLRRDARSNRDKLLVSAAKVFAERGIAAPMNDIAVAANVGVGTVYRHFSSKDALLEEVFRLRIISFERLAIAASHRSAWEGLSELIRQTLGIFAEDRGLYEYLFSRGVSAGSFEAMLSGLVPRVRELVDRARREGSIGDEVSETDFAPLVVMLAQLAHTDPRDGPHLAMRYAEIMLRGVAHIGGPSIHPGPPSRQTVARWLGELGSH